MMSSALRSTGARRVVAFQQHVLRDLHRPLEATLHADVAMANKRAFSTYREKKEAAKELRRQVYAQRQAHKEEVKLRRKDKPLRGSRKEAFKEWFRPKKLHEDVSNHQSNKIKMGWKIRVAVVLERLPVVLPDKPDWLREYDDMKTYLDQFERTYPDEMFGELEILEPEDLTDEAFLALLPRGYTPAPRETEADHNGDVKTLDRRLKTRIYLTVKDKANNNASQWQFPAVDLKDDETMLEAAKRALKDKIGSNGIELFCPSNCPVAVDLDVCHEEERTRNNIYGTKTFFIKIQYDDGKVDPDLLEVEDYAWLERSEIVERVQEEQGEEKAKLYYYML